MKSDCVFLGGLLIAVGAIVAFMGYLSKDPLCCVVAAGVNELHARQPVRIWTRERGL